ncbi:3',5'-cyclic-AMP phosphodiesterase [Atopomonas sediminilitoris]|uniref:3',5'-cyclic-AMP phosphodiesterase n=1 Tax=Atopomonas sediminilitoris TaxID=2919919 RepID=UPI001F4E900E|nr:3',5'-cyclic-AMP phosphodiesterase [Atopomonas sediminilitoris]MCJ8168527.1 3',5'-cyclic-AMP phosphodiesterase [Atopomonas sediminilitoris]
MYSLIDAPNDRPLTVVQLSDSHLFAQADGRLLGMETAHSLGKVVERVQAEQAQIDLLLATGDLAQDASLAAYQQFDDLTRPLNAPQRWLAGNHDECAPMQQFCQADQRLAEVTDIGAWRVIMLNTHVLGSVAGFLDDEQLRTLDQALASAGTRHCLVVCHHHPVSVGCAWLEPIGIRNAAVLLARIDAAPQVKALLWGHIHQEYDQPRGHVRLLATPSTCVQFLPGSEEFKVDSQAPGYRWLRLHPDGGVETGVSRVSDIAFEVDYSVKGY